MYLVKAGSFYQHICSHLSVQLTCALMCLGEWCKLGYVTDSDVKAKIIVFPELHEDDDKFELDRHRVG